jgi:hypothetical protein
MRPQIFKNGDVCPSAEAKQPASSAKRYCLGMTDTGTSGSPKSQSDKFKEAAREIGAKGAQFGGGSVEQAADTYRRSIGHLCFQPFNQVHWLSPVGLRES